MYLAEVQSLPTVGEKSRLHSSSSDLAKTDVYNTRVSVSTSETEPTKHGPQGLDNSEGLDGSPAAHAEVIPRAVLSIW
jgi:hypothetical protein